MWSYKAVLLFLNGHRSCKLQDSTWRQSLLDCASLVCIWSVRNAETKSSLVRDDIGINLRLALCACAQRSGC